MAELGQNNCSPARIYGPLSQNIFCGCSIISFSVSAGWNEQSSNLTVELVEDTCAGQKVWWDKNLVRQSGVVADPGFTSPEVGCAAYFRIEEDPDGATEALRGGFEYCGIIQSWTEKFDAGGNPVYTVTMSDPRSILENTQVIVNHHPGTTSGVWNLVNAYGFVESLGGTCEASVAGAIGGVTDGNVIGNIANDRGMNWSDLKCAIHTLCSSDNRSLANSLYGPYCVDSRLVYSGPTTAQEGYGVLAKDGVITDPYFTTQPNVNVNKQYYLIDLSEIPFSPLYYRISGPTISLAEIISQVCSDAGCDYYLELLPVKKGGKVEKVIKVRVAVRQEQPQFGKLQEYIDAKQAQAENANGGVISYTKGQEIRNEETSSYIMGGRKREAYVADSTQILPFWGVNTDDGLLSAIIADDEYFVELDLFRLNTVLYFPFASRWVILSESEMRAALVDIDSWKSVAHAMATKLNAISSDNFYNHLVSINQSALYRGSKVYDITTGAATASSFILPPGSIKNPSDDMDFQSQSAKDLDKIYNFVREYADEYYGKQFLVNAPFVCTATDLESQKYRYSHDPSNQGCWVNDSVPTILGLTHNSSASDFFRDVEGKYHAILQFPTYDATTLGGDTGTSSIVTDPSRVNDSDYITDGVDSIWVKATVDPRWMFGTNLDTFADTRSFVIRIGAPVTNRTSSTDGSSDLIQSAAAVGIMGKLAGVPSLPVGDVNWWLTRDGFSVGAMPSPVFPIGALCPTVSNLEVYGPWGVVGLPGSVKLESDEGFVPWEYGSDTVMYNAALDKVASAVANMRKGERGSITVAGYPNIPLGAELFSVDSNNPPLSQRNQKYVGTRTYSIGICASQTTLSVLRIPMNAWVGDFGPNVTNVNVTVGAGGFTTQYQFSTYTPQYGRFQKSNAERLRQIGRTRLQNMRNLRSQDSIINQFRSDSKKFVENQIGRSSRAPKSAHGVFLGRYLSNGADRPEVYSQAVKDVGLAFPHTGVYAETAMMSLDGLLRPVSKSGDGGLSAFVAYTGATGVCTSGFPLLQYDSLLVEQTYLDPLSNPSSTLLTERSDVPLSGHDIEILGRNTTPPSSGWPIIEGAEDGEGYAEDYRFFAMKGPIMIQQWGYDTDNKPIPNKIDVYDNTVSGKFECEGLQDKFLDSFLQLPKSWPVAPLDIRLDRKRGVWTIPNNNRNIHVTFTGECVYPSGSGLVNNMSGIFDAAGDLVVDGTVNSLWPWDIHPPTGLGKIPVYYDDQDCEYYSFPVNRLDISVGTSADDADITDTYMDIKRLVFTDATVIETDCKNTAFVSVGGAGINIKAPQGGIPARNGATAGRVSCLRLGTVMNGDDADIVTLDPSESVMVYNSVTLTVLDNGERIGQAILHDDGLWWAIVGDCNDEINTDDESAP